MKECEKVRNILCRYLDNETNARDTAFIQEHLKNCPLCEKELTELSQVKVLLANKERKVLPENYLLNRVRGEIAGQHYRREKLPWVVGLGIISRRLIPVPVTAIIVAMVFLLLGSGKPASSYSLEEHLLSGDQTTTETALGLILGVQN